MRWLNDIWFRVRALFTRDAMERELAEEFAFHVEREAEKHEAAGMAPAEALRVARIRFGGEERFKEQARESWGVGAFTDLANDIRFSRRQVLKNPAFSALAIITLALGIGGTVALFSVVNGLMLRPLPVPDEDRVVTWWSPFNWMAAEFDHVRTVARAYEGLAAFSNDAYTLEGETSSSLVLATVGSANLFDVLAVPAALGRTFLPGEDRPGGEPVVVLSHALWQQQLGGNPSIVGRQVNLGGVRRTVVGVMPAGFYFPTPESDLFLPLTLDPADPDYAGNGWLSIVGRLHPSVTDAQVTEDLGVVTAALGERFTYPDAWDKTRSPYVTPLREYLFGDVRPALLLLLAAVGTLLLMACVNVAALLLTRTVDRTREMAVRTALGAGRGRLGRQIATESVFLGCLSGLLGMALAVGLFDVLVASLPIDPEFRDTLHIDWLTIASALVLAVVCGSAVALAPLRNLLRGNVAESGLTDRSQGAGTAHAGRMQATLVTAEVLLGVVLVTGASLLVRTVDHLRAVEIGFETRGVLTLDVLAAENETTSEQRAAFHEEFLARARSVPGVSEVALVNRLPLRDGGWQGPVSIDGRPELQGLNRPNAMYRPMTPGAFDVLGARLVAGRTLLPSDREDSPLVVVINESFARRVWGNESPLGGTYRTGFVGTVEVVGVVEDMAVTDLIGDRPMVGYYPWAQAHAGSSYAIVMARTTGDPLALAGPLRDLASELEPRAAVDRVQTLDDALEAEMSEALRLRFFLGLFSVLGIVLGTVGVYGVVSYSVQRRQAEFGIRQALGAKPGSLVGSVLKRGLAPVALGIVGGTGVALFAAGLLSRFLFEVRPVDPASMGVAALTLLVAGICAAAVPALRASRTPPAVALRAE